VNVTTALNVGRQVRVCNDGWSSFAEFDKVAFIHGSVLAKADMEESQAMGLLQVLRAADSSTTADWALQYLKRTLPRPGITIQMHNNQTLRCTSWHVGCSSQQTVVSVDTLVCREPDSAAPLTIADGIRLLPSMDKELVAALLSLTELTSFDIDIGGGKLFPELANFQNITDVLIIHYCLQGPLPTNLITWTVVILYPPERTRCWRKSSKCWSVRT
jgi:hypothetical protein